ncbi:peptidoglycan DD-metalloendopeptidase family protein [Pseudomonas sp. RL]|uniref:murein hydrolase activator EnvC family protein n=1 Tax=Pseudomonas sp. RL TaxID=1452718 RepID=UPI000486550A|nr:peptidoglycan DD-metalloendopeptidase family protein [Pseudomonas sp. RL]
MFRALFLALLTCLAPPAGADSKVQTEQQLEAARKEVLELKKMLEQLQREKSQVQQQLRQTETEAGALEKQIRDLRREAGDNQKQLDDLERQKKKIDESRREQQRLIGQQARSLYQSGGAEPLKLLLNQQDPATFSRTLTYYEYLNRARLEQLADYARTREQLGELERQRTVHSEALARKQQALGERQARLAEVRKERQQVLARLNRDSANRADRLQERQREQAELQQVLKTIEETLARQAREREAEAARQRQLAEQRRQAPADEAPWLSNTAVRYYGGPFGQAQGKLPWPVEGRLIARFGAPRGEDSRTTWDGVLIGASAGQPVRAVHGGKVVFAEWLRGAGLLLILDHGGGYLSLYGHNQALLKEAGDIVAAGDTIATVGSSGGQSVPALYFAIRQQGRPSDPAQWCRAQG